MKIKDLPPRIQKKAIENTIAYRRKNGYKRLSYEQMIEADLFYGCESFFWKRSPEGYDYWVSVNNGDFSAGKPKNSPAANHIPPMTTTFATLDQALRNNVPLVTRLATLEKSLTLQSEALKFARQTVKRYGIEHEYSVKAMDNAFEAIKQAVGTVDKLCGDVLPKA